jgi:hypothetical protein
VSPYTIKQSVDGGFYLGGEYGLLKLDAAGNRLWSVLYPTVESSGWLTSAEGNMAVDAADNVYASINTYLWEPHILKYNSQGNLLKDQLLSVTSPDSDPAVFGVAYGSTSKRIYAAFSYWSSAREGYVAAIAMFDEDLNLIKKVDGPAGIDWSYGSVTGIGVDSEGNVYVGGSRTASFIYVLKYDPGLNLLFAFAKDPVAPKMFIGGETIPNGGYYIINNELIDNTLHNISASGAEQWFRSSGLDRYIHGVDGGGNFYGVDNSQTPQFSKLGYADGVVKWTMPEPHSVMIDAVFIDGQDRIYTAGYLAEPVGDADSYVARYTQGGGDTTAPAQVSNLAVAAVSSNSVTLSWTAPGDDGLIGTASSYDLRYTTTGAITADAEFNAAAQTQGEPAPQTAGTLETFTMAGLAPGTTYFFALKTADEVGNISVLSNSPKGITAAVPKDRYEIFGSTEPTIVVVSTYSPLLVSSVNILGTTNPAREIAVNFSVSTYPAGAAGFSLSKSSEATNPQGLADVLLKLGNIPAEYGVTATCPSCEASSDTVTFTCCGKLPNDHFSQTYTPTSPWNVDCYARHNCQVEDRTTIGYLGCATTALATVVNYYATHISTSIPTRNPGQLNTYLREMPGVTGYDANNNVQPSAITSISSGSINYIRNESGNISRNRTIQVLLNRMDSEVLDSRPVMLQINRLHPDGTYTPHYIVAVGKCGDRYIIADPIGGVERLYSPTDPAASLLGIRVFRP